MDGWSTQVDAAFYHFQSTQLPSLENPSCSSGGCSELTPIHNIIYHSRFAGARRETQKGSGKVSLLSFPARIFETPAKFPSGHCSNNYACMQLMFPDCFWSAVPVPSPCSPVEITRAGWNTQAGQNSTPWKISEPLLLEEIFQPTQNREKKPTKTPQP